MHTMTFNPDDLDIELDGRASSLFELFPGFNNWDRFGIVIDASVGMLGASLLIHSFAATYFKYRRSNDALVAHYPEMYAIHVGGCYADLRMLDFLPERKEVFVSDAKEALAALNHVGVTRVAVPDGPRRDTKFHYWEVGPVRDRVRTAFLYSPDGTVESPNVVLTGRGSQVFDSFHCVYDIRHTLEVHGPAEEDQETWSATLRDRAGEVLERDATRAHARWTAARHDGAVVESYRTLPSPSDVLRYL